MGNTNPREGSFLGSCYAPSVDRKTEDVLHSSLDVSSVIDEEFVLDQPPAPDANNILDIFKMFDEDNDGYLNMEELNTLKNTLGLPELTDKDYAQGCRHYGADPNQGWDVSQFKIDLGNDARIVYNMLFVEQKELLAVMFEGLDANEDGFLSLDEVNTLKDTLEMPALTHEEFESSCARYGADPLVGWNEEHLRRDLGSSLYFVYNKLLAKATAGDDRTVGRGTAASEDNLLSHRGAISDLAASRISVPSGNFTKPPLPQPPKVDDVGEALTLSLYRSVVNSLKSLEGKAARKDSNTIDKREIASAPDLLSCGGKGRGKGAGKGKRHSRNTYFIFRTSPILEDVEVRIADELQ